jgi:hypothetical protein
MKDTELLEQLDLSIADAAKIIKVSRQVLHRGLKEDDVSERRGVVKSDKSSTTTAHYLNADRLLALWHNFVAKGEERAANLIRDVMIERHPEVGEMISPFAENVGSPRGVRFSECWVFSGEPLEIDNLEFREGMKAHLQASDRRHVYFVPTEAVANQLLTVLQVASDRKLREVFIVVTSAVSLSPHWFVLFDFQVDGGKTHKVFAGVMPEPPEGQEMWRQVVKVPDSYFRSARNTLMAAELLDAHDRFNPHSKRRKGDSPQPDFTIYYPRTEVSK